MGGRAKMRCGWTTCEIDLAMHEPDASHAATAQMAPCDRSAQERRAAVVRAVAGKSNCVLAYTDSCSPRPARIHRGRRVADWLGMPRTVRFSGHDTHARCHAAWRSSYGRRGAQPHAAEPEALLHLGSQKATSWRKVGIDVRKMLSATFATALRTYRPTEASRQRQSHIDAVSSPRPSPYVVRAPDLSLDRLRAPEACIEPGMHGGEKPE